MRWTAAIARSQYAGWTDMANERGARAYNGGLEAERPPPTPPPCKNSSDLYQFQRPVAKVGVDISTPAATPLALDALVSRQHERFKDIDV